MFVKASQVKDTDMPPLTAEIAREIELEMQYPGVIKVTVIRETTAMATAPAQLVPVRAAVAEHAGHHEPELDEASPTRPATTTATDEGRRHRRSASVAARCQIRLDSQRLHTAPRSRRRHRGRTMATTTRARRTPQRCRSRSAPGRGVRRQRSTGGHRRASSGLIDQHHPRASTPTSTPAPRHSLRGPLPPRPTTSVDAPSPGPFGGSWTGNGRRRSNVSSDESAQRDVLRRRALQLRVAVLRRRATTTACSPTIPGGQLKLHVTRGGHDGRRCVASCRGQAIRATPSTRRTRS